MAEHLYTYDDPPNQRHLDQICSVLDKNGVLVMPAGTSWMFCCDAASKKAVQRMMALKPGRDERKPPSGVQQHLYGYRDGQHRRYGLQDAQSHRPGHFTVLLKSSRMLPKILKNKREIVGLRVPDEPLALAVIEQYEGRPLVSTSVPEDSAGQVLTMGYQIAEAHGHGLDLVVDLGEEINGQPTTILDLTQNEIEVIREGAGDLSLL